MHYDIVGNAAAVQRVGLTLKLASNVLLGFLWFQTERVFSLPVDQIEPARQGGTDDSAAVIDGS